MELNYLGNYLTDEQLSSYCITSKVELFVNATTNNISPCRHNTGVTWGNYLEGNQRLDTMVSDINSGNLPSACNMCKILDSKPRIYQNKHWRQPNQGNSHLELISTNKCSASCIYCSPMFSSAWYTQVTTTEYPFEINLPENQNLQQDEAIYAEMYKYIKAVAIDDTVTPCITFIGGEPTEYIIETDYLNKAAKIFENNLQSDRRLRVDLNTNLGFNKDTYNIVMPYIEDCVNKYSHLDVIFEPSIESVGDNFEFVRHGLKWSDFDYNFKSILRRGYGINVKTMINNVSLASITEFIEYLTKTARFYKPNNMYNLQILQCHEPKIFCLSILDESFRKYFEQAIEYVEQNGSVFDFDKEHIISLLRDLWGFIGNASEEEKIEQSKNALVFYDWIEKTRGQRLVDVNPELYDYFVKMSEKNG